MKQIIFDYTVSSLTQLGTCVYAKSILRSLVLLNSVTIDVFDLDIRAYKYSGFCRRLIIAIILIRRELYFAFVAKNKIVYLPTPLPSFVLLLFRKNFVLTIHDLYAYNNPDKSTFSSRLQNILLGAMLAKAKAVVTVSEYSKNCISRMIRSTALQNIQYPKIYIIPPCITPNPYISLSSHVIRQQILRISSGPLLLLFLGANEPRKNIPFLIEVFISVCTLFKLHLLPLPYLVMSCSEGWMQSSVSKLLFDSDFSHLVVITGYMSDQELSYIYSRPSIVLSTSKEEGFGLPSIEAIINGNHSIVSDNSALSEQEKFGATVIPIHDAKLWSREILRLFATKSYMKKPAGEINPENYFSIEKCIDRLSILFSSL